MLNVSRRKDRGSDGSTVVGEEKEGRGDGRRKDMGEGDS